MLDFHQHLADEETWLADALRSPAENVAQSEVPQEWVRMPLACELHGSGAISGAIVTDRATKDVGVRSAAVFPTLPLRVSESLFDDPSAGYRHLRNFNSWLRDVVGFDTRRSAFAIPMLSFLEPRLALVEAENLVDAGARMICLLPSPPGVGAPQAGSEQNHHLWRLLAEEGVVVAVHATHTAYSGLYGWHQHRGAELATGFDRLVRARATQDLIASIGLEVEPSIWAELKLLLVGIPPAWLRDVLGAIDERMPRMGLERPRGRLLQTEPLSTELRRRLWATVSSIPIASAYRQLGVDRLVLGSGTWLGQLSVDTGNRIRELLDAERDQLSAYGAALLE